MVEGDALPSMQGRVNVFLGKSTANEGKKIAAMYFCVAREFTTRDDAFRLHV